MERIVPGARLARRVHPCWNEENLGGKRAWSWYYYSIADQFGDVLKCLAHAPKAMQGSFEDCEKLSASRTAQTTYETIIWVLVNFGGAIGGRAAFC